MQRILLAGLFGGALGALAPALHAEEIGSVDTVFQWLGPDHKIVIEAFDDPKIDGVTCYVSRSKTGGIKGGLGLAEDTDAVVIAISEETGAISLAFRGRLIRGLDEERLRRILTTILARAPRIRSRWQRLRSALDLSAEGLAHTEEMMEREIEDTP